MAVGRHIGRGQGGFDVPDEADLPFSPRGGGEYRADRRRPGPSRTAGERISALPLPAPFALAGLGWGPCNLCPRRCGARRDEGQRGFCGAGGEMLVARAALHFWEEPPISGESGSGTVFFAHCPLRCIYCQNASLAQGKAGAPVSVSRLAQICRELEGKGALNVNFVTPTHYAPAIAQAVMQARERGFSLPVVWNTSGYERREAIRALAGVVDVYLADFKYADPMLAARYSQVPDYAEVALAAIEEMVAQTGAPRFDGFRGQRRMIGGTVVRHLLLPGALEQSKEALGMLFERFGDTVAYSIMNQYTPVISGEEKAKFPQLAGRVPDAEYELLLDYADQIGLTEYFWQEGGSASESFVPAWDGEGV